MIHSSGLAGADMESARFADIEALERENAALRQEVERLRHAHNNALDVVAEATSRRPDTASSGVQPTPVRTEMAALRREIEDLKIMLDTATSHADEIEAELYKKHAEISRLYKQLSTVNRELQTLANSDGLTGIANRRRFDEVLAQEWRRHSRQSADLALILLDIDFFKAFNDTYGHLAGDGCLRQLAQVLVQTIERPADLIARYGGEEFALLLPETQLAGALHVAERIRAQLVDLNLSHESSGVSDRVTASLGVSATVPTAYIAAETLVMVADRALYDAKMQGRDRFIGVEF
ncbi:MAG: diguanylate cyclase [Cyanobacteria bacterium P01_F01_bin.33]